VELVELVVGQVILVVHPQEMAQQTLEVVEVELQEI
tara:strand:- start:169 stop:276 length:108 start_codon:yes stop_codon:yes gene_type:complete